MSHIELMTQKNRKIPEELNPYTREKFEAIQAYDQYDSVIAELNQSFHHTYNLLIHKTHHTLGEDKTPVIIMFRDTAMLFHDDKQEVVEVFPDLYHKIKATGHVSFGVYLALANNGYGPLQEDNREGLEIKQELIEKTLSILEQESIPQEFMQNMRKTMESALAIIQEVLASGQVEESRVWEFGKENGPLYLESATLGAILELDALHTTVMHWKKQLGPENWERIYVVVCAGHQARYREAAKQYFLRLLHERESLGADAENRVIYAENIANVDGALDLLARHIIDQRSSIALFNDGKRMQQDLMSDGAAAYLKELFPD